MEDTDATRTDEAPRPTDEHDRGHDIYTLANIITVLRLMLIPIFLAVLLSERSDVVAFAIYAAAASTDWVDGQIARRTGTVSEIGKAMDPLVDRLLIASGVLGVYLEGRVPLWIVAFLLVRDGYLLFGAAQLARKGLKSVPVIYIGKVTTALLLFGFSALIVNWPMLPGLGLIGSAYLPGWGGEPAALGIWFIYVGAVTSLITAVRYSKLASERLREAGG